MPVLKNARHERFAQALAKGMTAEKAYVEAGYKPNRHNAAALAREEHILTRVAELQAKVAEKATWSALERMAALQRIAERLEKDDPKVTISAISEANKMDGSYAPAKREITGANGGPIEYANLTEEEIDARIAALSEGAGEAES